MTKQELLDEMRVKAQMAKSTRMRDFWLGNIKSVDKNYPPMWK
jgi:hypothetical protein